jgi:hypothetical protein
MTHLPDVGGLTFQGMATTEGAIDGFGGDELFHEEQHSRSTVGEQSPAAIGVVNSTQADLYGAAPGEFVSCLYTDAITIAHRFRSANGANPLGQGFGKILGSSMGLYDPTATGANPASYTASADSSDETEVFLSDADAANIAIGAPLSFARQDEMVDRYSIVTAKTENADGNGNTSIELHPKLDYVPTNGQTVKTCFAFYPVVGAANAAQRDLHLLFNMGGTGSSATVRRLASLSRCAGFSLSNDGNGVGLSMTVRPACVLRDDANASTVDTPEAPGPLLQHRFGCRVDVSDNIKGMTPPLASPRSTLPNFDWGVEVSFSLSPSSPDTKSLLSMDAMEINNATASVTITGENSPELQSMISKDQHKTIILGMGPSGDGGAFILKNGSRADGSANPSSGDGGRIQQQTTLRAVSDFGGAVTSGLAGADLLLATAPFILVLPAA